MFGKKPDIVMDFDLVGYYFEPKPVQPDPA